MLYVSIVLAFPLYSGLKQCVEVGVLSSRIFDDSVEDLEDPTAVGITTFVLGNLIEAKPSKVKRMATLFEGFGYLSLASAMTGESVSITIKPSSTDVMVLYIFLPV